jgi:hypothetical protein
MASSAGLNRLGARGGEVLLTLQPGSPAGDLDSGIMAAEGIGFSKWVFQIIGAGSSAAGYTVTLYGTIDPAAYNAVWGYPGNPAQNIPAIAASGMRYKGLPSTSWFQLPGPSEQSGTGNMSNPMISGISNTLFTTLPLVAVRATAVISTTSVPTSPVQVLVFGVP